MKQQPGIGASPSLPISQRGESQSYDSDPETPPKRHRNGTAQHNTAPLLSPTFWVESTSHLGWSPAT
jgi:hypothetical protein